MEREEDKVLSSWKKEKREINWQNHKAQKETHTLNLCFSSQWRHFEQSEIEKEILVIDA